MVVALEGSLEVISDAFWVMATAQLMVAIGLVLQLRRVPKREASARHFAIVWAVILGKGSELHEPLCIAGGAVLAWLIVRSLRRLASSMHEQRRHEDG